MKAIGNIKAWIGRKIVTPIVDLLKQGITPEKVALSIALGCVVGVFPLMGTTMILCGIIGFALKLNPIAIQIVNYVMYPVQLLMIVPFIRLGEILTGQDPFPVSPAAILKSLENGFLFLIEKFGNAALSGILGWFVVTLPLAFVIYFVMLPILRKAAEKIVVQNKAEV